MAHNILIVESSPTARLGIKRIIEQSGLTTSGIYEAASASAALSWIHVARIDLVLADLHMPEMSGIEFSHQVRMQAGSRMIPVVLTSWEPSHSAIDDLRRQGVRGHIQKPLTAEGVRVVLGEILAAGAVDRRKAPRSAARSVTSQG
jgi:CheY-like chemotaxis protein